MFNAEEYKKELSESSNIAEVEKVPLPIVKDDQNYIFISYSHKDYKQVYSDLADMYEAGVRFWYDSELKRKPGEGWDLKVKGKITDPHCCGCIFYFSKNSCLSASIKREISIADGKDEITGEIISNPKPSFYINLTQEECPSDVIASITREEKHKVNLDSRWYNLLYSFFDDNKTYLKFSESKHKIELIDAICDKYNVMNDPDIIILADGDYKGETVNGEKHGNGVFEYYSGHKYDGKWANDQRNGYGVLSRKGKIIYEGEWEDDKKSGHGIIHYADGGIYDGEWKDNKINGHGKITYSEASNRLSFEGEFNDGAAFGKGIFMLKDGTVYDGEWENDKLNGFATLSKNGKTIYSGFWKDGEYNGHGTKPYDNDVYDGEWKNGKRDGIGTYTYADGKQWTGEWKEDKKWTGSGTIYYYINRELNGNSYNGDLVNGEFNGHGVYFKDGTVYDGEWKDGKRDGIGTYTYADEGESKRTYTGEWKDDRMEGKGVYTYRDKSIYEGDFVNWTFEGHGIRRYADGDVYDGEWKNDKKNGIGTYTYADGKQWIGEWKEDKKWTGTGTIYYYTDGKLNGNSYNGDLVNGEFNGHGVYCFSSNSFYDGEWKDGKSNGFGFFEESTVYYDGDPIVKKRKSGTWKDGKIIDGQLIMYKKGENDDYKVVSIDEGKFDYNQNLIGEIKLTRGKKTKNKISVPSFPVYFPNIRIFRSLLESVIWQFDGDSCATPNGYGKATYYDGTVVEGNFSNGKIADNEQYKVTYVGGDIYTGTLKNNMRCGNGQYISTDGDEIDGTWENDCLVKGHGIMMEENGNKYEGEFKKGKYSGYGVLTKKDGTVLEGLWKNGKLKKEATNK